MRKAKDTVTLPLFPIEDYASESSRELMRRAAGRSAETLSRQL